MTRIDRTKAKETFAAYVDNYNSEDPKIKLKILHTYRVAELCDTIGASEGLSGEALDAAWMCGLLHDIGRFEQIRRYGTFQDAVSIDHALLSTTILFGEASVCEENGSRVFVPQNAKGGSIRSFSHRQNGMPSSAPQFLSQQLQASGNLDEKQPCTVRFCGMRTR